MASLLGKLLRLLLVLAALAVPILGGLWLFGPREEIRRATTLPVLTPDSLAAREAGIEDIVPGAEARVIWAGQEGAKTDWVVLYLHGFSASAAEIRPVPDDVAAALGANLIFARLPGHGRTGAAMGGPNAGAWIDDTAAMLALARSLGERVLVIGTSTGGTLAAWAATDPEMAEAIGGIVLVSPNVEIADPNAWVLELPLAGWFVPRLVGAERGFTPLNDAQAEFWTERYPTIATVRLAALVRGLRGRDVGAVDIPALMLFSDADQVVRPAATRALAARWGGPVTLAPQVLPAAGADPSAHVIAGDIVSPAMTGPVTQTILDWVAALPEASDPAE